MSSYDRRGVGAAAAPMGVVSDGSTDKCSSSSASPAPRSETRATFESEQSRPVALLALQGEHKNGDSDSSVGGPRLGA